MIAIRYWVTHFAESENQDSRNSNPRHKKQVINTCNVQHIGTIHGLVIVVEQDDQANPKRNADYYP